MEHLLKIIDASEDMSGEFFNMSEANVENLLTSFSSKAPKSGFTMLMEKLTQVLHILIFKLSNLTVQ